MFILLFLITFPLVTSDMTLRTISIEEIITNPNYLIFYNLNDTAFLQSLLVPYENCDQNIPNLIGNLRNANKAEVYTSSLAPLQYDTDEQKSEFYIDLESNKAKGLIISSSTMCMYATLKEECLQCVKSISQSIKQNKERNSLLILSGVLLLILTLVIGSIYGIIKIVRTDTINKFLKIGLSILVLLLTTSLILWILSYFIRIG